MQILWPRWVFVQRAFRFHDRNADSQKRLPPIRSLRSQKTEKVRPTCKFWLYLLEISRHCNLLGPFQLRGLSHPENVESFWHVASTLRFCNALLSNSHYIYLWHWSAGKQWQKLAVLFCKSFAKSCFLFANFRFLFFITNFRVMQSSFNVLEASTYYCTNYDKKRNRGQTKRTVGHS